MATRGFQLTDGGLRPNPGPRTARRGADSGIVNNTSAASWKSPYSACTEAFAGYSELRFISAEVVQAAVPQVCNARPPTITTQNLAHGYRSSRGTTGC